MPFILEKHAVNREFLSNLDDVNRCIETLRSCCAAVVSAATEPIKPKVVWKIESFLQGLLYRSLAIAEGVSDQWNQGNGLASAILARAVLECAAIAWNFQSRIRAGIDANDLGLIDETAMAFTFKSMWPELLEKAPPLPNILSLIDAMDRSFRVDGNTRPVRAVYESLSELAHPNWPGTAGLYGNLNKDMFEIRFNEDNAFSSRVLALVVAGVGCIHIIDYCFGQVISWLPLVSKISERDRTQSMQQ